MAQEIVNYNVIKAKVQTFKLEQLKDVLQSLNMSRSGKKEELSNRILDLFKDAAHLNASGHRVVDQDKLAAAALVVDAAYKKLRAMDNLQHRSLALHRHVDEVEAQHRAAAGGANKRARITAPQAAAAVRQQVQPQQQLAGGELAVEEVIGRFLDGSEGLGLLNTQVRCLCAAVKRTEPLLQCCGACCGVWQHAECVKQQLTPKPGRQALHDAATHKQLVQRSTFFCERCRVSRADPFWELFDPTVMLPARGRLNGFSVNLNNMGDVPQSSTGLREVLLSRHQVTLLKAKEAEYKLQAFCLQLDDAVPFRFHWPVNASMTWSIPGMPQQQALPSRRGGAAKLGTNQRDEPWDLAAAVRGSPAHGPCNLSIELKYAEPEPHYIFMVAIMRRRTREQVKALMKHPESLEAAVERVRRHMRGASSSSSGAAASSSTAVAAAAPANGHAGPENVIDDDDDVVMGNTVVSLKDPYSNQRMAIAARFVDTAGAAPSAFDLDSFLEVAQATRKWMDPHSSKPSCVQSLQVDAYLTHILRVLAGLPEVTEVEITPEAHWRPAGSAAGFMCVLEQARDMRAAAAAAAAAAACAAAGAAGAAAGDSDEEDDEELFRREIAQMQDRKPQLLPQKGGAVEVIEILDSDDDEQPAQQQQQPPAAAAGAGTRPLAAGEQQQPQQRAQGGMVIRIPARTQLQQAAAAAGGVVSPRQQQQGISLGSAARAAAATAAAAVGPPVPVATGGQQQLAQGLAGSRPHSITQTSGAAGALQHQQHQQIQQLAPHHHQQQQQVPGTAMLQQQLPAGMMQQQQQQPQRLQVLPAGYGGGLGAPQGPGPMLMVQGSSMAMQGSLPMLSMAMGSMGMPGVQQQLQGQMPMPLQQVQYAPQPGLQFVYQPGSPVLYSYQQGLPPQQQQQQPVQYVNVQQQQQQQPLGVPVYQQQQQNPYQAYVPQQVYQHEQQVPVYQQHQPPQQQQQLGGYAAAGGTYQ